MANVIESEINLFFPKLGKELISMITLAVFFCISNYSFAADSVIKVYYNQEIGRVNKKIFGSAFLGYDYSLHNPDINYHYYGY